MSLADAYEQQARWRHFGQAMAHLPITRGERVLDLGCGVGSATALLAAEGAEVLGVDLDDGLLARARLRHPSLRFERCDLRSLGPGSFGVFDGVWSSFVAAYFHVPTFVARCSALVRPGGWLALVEIDDLLGHAPRTESLARDVDTFYAWARDRGGYGFRHGSLLAPALRDAGFSVTHEGVLADDELSFDGPAAPDILDAWRGRFARMGGMQSFFGPRFDEVSAGVLGALADPSHRAICRVVVVVARQG